MIVPKALYFPMPLSEERLPAAACLYDAASSRGSTFDEIIGLLERGAHVDDERATLPLENDFRVGLAFQNGADVVQRFYFEDALIGRTIKGYSTWKERSGRIWLEAQASFSDLIRELVARPDVVPIGRGGGVCVHR